MDAWQALQAHAADTATTTLRERFDSDPARGERLAAEGAGWYLDYSKQRVGDDTLRLLLELAETRGVRARIEAMFTGAHVNATEDRPALHVALRAPFGTRIEADGQDVVPEVHAVLDAWPHLRIGSAAAIDADTPENACATS